MTAIRYPILPTTAAGATGAALHAPGRKSASHANLAQSADSITHMLAARNFGPGKVVAIVLPNGPAMVSVFLAVIAIASAAPLNPSYSAEEFRFYLKDLQADLLICPSSGYEKLVEVAAELHMTVLYVDEDAGAAAGFVTVSDKSGNAVTGTTPDRNEAGDTVLLLHTSGTTARPKQVGLTRSNLEASTRNIIDTLELSPDDRGLAIMPLFHIHGLIATLCAPLAAGGSIICPGGFNALGFFRLLAEFEPSWYSAVPTMHQAILARADRNRDVIAASDLRFIRSSSAALPIPVLEALERTFRCPVIEAYGMTEATHQISSNRLPPGNRCAGTVGWPTGAEVRIRDDSGDDLPTGQKGEIVIRGANVHRGYVNAPDANAASFYGDWFRTGDQGYLAPDGGLTITGRLKEIINRGGEKISPLEIDNAVLRHPAVAEAVAFAIPHRVLGEDIAVAIVADGEPETLKKDLRAFLRDRLAAFKIPGTIVILDNIPKGPTGKIQRRALAGLLGLGG